MITLDQVADSIYFQFRKRQYDSLQKRRIGVFHVTDYVKGCMRNAYYSHIQTDAKKSMDTNTMSIFFSGESVHQLLDSAAPAGLGETPLAYNFIQDKKVELVDAKGKITAEAKAYSVREWLDILIGEADSLYKIEVDGKSELVLVDYKTWLSKGYKKKEASDEHVFQVNEYRYLFSKTLGLDVKYGAVVYLDFADRLQKPLIFPFKLKPLEEIRVDLAEKHKQLVSTFETGKLPPRVKSWLCDGYCNFAERCVNEEELTKEENKLQVTL